MFFCSRLMRCKPHVSFNGQTLPPTIACLGFHSRMPHLHFVCIQWNSLPIMQDPRCHSSLSSGSPGNFHVPGGRKLRRRDARFLFYFSSLISIPNTSIIYPQPWPSRRGVGTNLINMSIFLVRPSPYREADPGVSCSRLRKTIHFPAAGTTAKASQPP